MADPAPGATPNSQQQPCSAMNPKTMTDVLALPPLERALVNWLVRQQGASLVDILAHWPVEHSVTLAMVERLRATGFLLCNDAADPAFFRANMISRQPRALPEQVWQALD